MSAKRRDDRAVPNAFRTDRMVQDGGMWFFYTREGTLEGPYDGQLEATLQLDKYINVMTSGLLETQTYGLEENRKHATGSARQYFTRTGMTPINDQNN